MTTIHRKMRGTKDHTLQLVSERGSATSERQCAVHREKIVSFCELHNANLCATCLVAHLDHAAQVKSVADAALTLGGKLIALGARVQQWQRRVEASASAHEKLEATIDANHMAAEAAIQLAYNQVPQKCTLS